MSPERLLLLALTAAAVVAALVAQGKILRLESELGGTTRDCDDLRRKVADVESRLGTVRIELLEERMYRSTTERYLSLRRSGWHPARIRAEIERRQPSEPIGPARRAVGVLEELEDLLLGRTAD